MNLKPDQKILRIAGVAAVVAGFMTRDIKVFGFVALSIYIANVVL